MTDCAAGGEVFCRKVLLFGENVELPPPAGEKEDRPAPGAEDGPLKDQVLSRLMGSRTISRRRALPLKGMRG